MSDPSPPADALEGPAGSEPAAGLLLSLLASAVLAALIGVTGVVLAAVARPWIQQVQGHANEAAAVEALRSIVASQGRYRDEDLDGNGAPDYASLGQLGLARLVDPDLASGVKGGYVFEASVSEREPRGRWMATASPEIPGETGRRHFAANHTGGIYWRCSPFPLDLERCEMPPDAVPYDGR